MGRNFLRAAKARPHFVGYLNACRCELYKIKSTRSSYVTVFFSALAIVGLSVAVCTLYSVRSDHLSLYRLAATDPVFLSLSGTFLAQLGVVVFAVLSVTNEYGYGTIVTSLLLEPKRIRFALAKITVVVCVILLSSLLSLTAAFVFGERILSAKFHVIGMTSFTAVRTVVGAALYLSALGAICGGLSLIIRRTSGAIAAVFAILLVVPLIASLLPAPWDTDITRYLPSSAGVVLVHASHPANMMSPAASLLLLLFYSCVCIAGGLYFICRRDG